MILEILQHPDPRLQERCAPVDDPSSVPIEDMFETMYTAEGRGLAAPQVGIQQRFFIMDTSWKEGEMAPSVFINPEIQSSGGEQISVEACLSIADQSRRVTRPEWVKISWTALDGSPETGRFEGFAAACICHEIDHLDGRLILDHPEAA